MPKTWDISDIDGSNRRTVTLASYRAEIEAAKSKAMAAFRRDAASVGVDGDAFLAAARAGR